MNIVVNAQPADVPRTVQPVGAPDHQRVRHSRPRCRRGVSPRAGPRRMGDSRAREGDGAQHPRHSRRRREPHLLRRPLQRVLDLRHRLPRHPQGRPASARHGGPALLRHRPVHRRRPHGGLGRVLFADLRLHAAAGQGALRHHAQGAAAAEPVPHLLPPADRARRPRAVRARRGAPAAHRLRHPRRAGHRRGASRSAGSSSSRRSACRPTSAAR